MSVIKNKRSLSDLEFFHNAIKLRTTMTDLLLRDILCGIREQSAELGLFINEKKTQIFKLRHGFTFLKIKYNLTETGKIIKRPSRDNITRQRRKMKKFKHLVDEGRMSLDDARNETKSWLGANEKLNAYRTCQNIRTLFRQLFGEDV